MAMKNYEARLYLKSGGASVPVQIAAQNPSEAKKLIEAQYAGQIKGWAKSPTEVRK